MLRPASYQLVALTKLLAQGPAGGLLTTDGVGVGKTISAGYCISWTATAESGCVVVVCPVGLVDKWLLELRDKFGLKAQRIANQDELKTAESEMRHSRAGRVYVVPFSSLERLGKLAFDLVVIDEIHNFRNRETKGWEAARSLAKRSRRRLGLSATPINNATVDLANIYAILFPDYSPLVTDAVLIEAWDGRQLDKLAGTLTRFTKEQLGIHFARRKIWEIPVSFPDSYANWVLAAVEHATGKKPTTGKYPLETITYFRAASSSPAAFMETTGAKAPPLKTDPKADALAEILAQRAGQMIVFCQFRRTVEYLAQFISDRPVHTLTGDVPAFDRGAVIKAFKADPEGVLIMTAVGAEGLDLQFCSAVTNYDLHWNPMVLEQRIGRVDRIGQRKDIVEVFNFHVANSIDEKVLQTIRKKLDLTVGTPLATVGVASSRPLYDPVSLSSEAKEAEQLVKALGAYRGMSLDDDRILSSIDDRFCQPKVLGDAAPMAWLSTATEAQTWLTGVKVSQAKLAAELQRFQKLVGA